MAAGALRISPPLLEVVQQVVAEVPSRKPLLEVRHPTTQRRNWTLCWSVPRAPRVMDQRATDEQAALVQLVPF